MMFSFRGPATLRSLTLIAACLAAMTTAQAESPVSSNAIVEGLVPISGVEGLPQDRSVDLTVEFASGSAQITAEGRAQLDLLGAAINDPRLGGLVFDIVGHTDARGAAEYNLALSEARAVAVATYLVRAHGIDPGRIAPYGEGESRLKNELDPESAENRRVEIMAHLPDGGRSPLSVPKKSSGQAITN